jgi:hypothetical protein
MPKRGGPGGDFPLDNAFDDLRQVVEDVADAFADLKEQVKKVFSGGTGAGPAVPRGTVSPGGIGLDRDTEKTVKELAKIQQFFSQIKAAKEGLKAGGTVAQALGLPGATAELDKIAKRVDVIGNLAIGIVSTVRALRVVFLPVVGAIGLIVAGLVGVQQVVNRVTGTSATLKQTFVELGLQMKRGFASANLAAVEFYQTISGRTPQTIASIRRARAELSKVEQEIITAAAESSAASGGRAPAALADLSLSEIFKESKAQLGELAEASASVIDEAFRALDLAIEQRGQKAAPSFTRTDGGGVGAFGTFMQDLERVGDLTANTFAFIESGVQQLSSTISSVLISAFLDPQADIRETFGQLFRALAQQLLQLMIQALVVRAVSGIAGSFAGSSGGNEFGSFSTSQTQFFADGGKVGTGGRASLAHYLRGARGLVGGGFGRPSWIPSSDTVAAWLTPGEFVEPLRAVKHYGVRVMEGLRSLSIPREPLLALASGVSAPAAVASPGPGPRGYAAGGPVAGGSGSAGGVGGPVIATVVPSEQSLARMLAGGSGAMMRYLRENRHEIRSLIQ